MKFSGKLAVGQWTNSWILVAMIRIRIQIWIWIRIHIVTLVRHALAEVCTVPVLLVTACYRNVTFSFSVNTALSWWQIHFTFDLACLAFYRSAQEEDEATRLRIWWSRWLAGCSDI